MNRTSERDTFLNMRRLMLLMPALIVACGDAPQDDGQILASVGSEVITVPEFVEEMQLRGGRQPDRFAEAGQREELLDEMIRWRVLVAEARSQEIDREPEIRRMIERLLVQRLHESRVSAELEAVEVTDREVADFYRVNEDEFALPARIQGAIIQVEVAAGADGDVRGRQRTRAEEALAAARELPEDVMHFGPVAVEYSDDRVSRYQGGVIGWLVDRPGQRHRWDDAVVDALFALETPGDMSPVIETGDGYYLVRLVAREDPRVSPLERVADGIRHRLLRERRMAVEKGLLDKLDTRHAVNIDRAVFESIKPPATGGAAPPERSVPRPPDLPGGGAPPPEESTVTPTEIAR